MMLPYSASDMIRAMQRHHGFTPDPRMEDQNAPARIRQGEAPAPSRLRRWIGAVASFLTLL
jgi:hypothetical protein